MKIKEFSKKILSTVLTAIIVVSVFTVAPIASVSAESTSDSFSSMSDWVSFENGVQDSTVFQSNAKCNSQMSTPAGSDGPATYAFDGQVGTWWHSWYNNGSAITEADGVDGSLDVTDTIWIQTGFVDGNDGTTDKRMISGINYYGRTAGHGHIRDFEVWVSDNENMEDHIVAFSATDYPYVTNSNQRIYFRQPVAGTYVRLVVTKVWTEDDGYIGDKHVAAAEYGFFQITNENKKSALSLAVEEANTFISSYSDFFTNESIQNYQSAITDAENYVNGLDGNDIDENVAYPLINNMRTAYLNLVKSDYFAVTLERGLGVESVTLDPNGNQYYSNGNVYYFGAGKHNVILDTQSSDDSKLTFEGWYKDGQKVSSTSSYNVEVSENCTFTSEYIGFNGAPASDTVSEITDYTTLENNAKASSEQYEMVTNDGDARYAFNNTSDKWWHTRYSGSTKRDNNTIDGLDCDSGNTDLVASPDNPIWIQTGFSQEKLLGGFSYECRGESTNMIGDFEVWVSNDENMLSHQVIFSGTYDQSKEDPLTEGQTVYFDAPYEAQYIRFVISSKSGTGGVHITAKKIGLFEYIGKTASTNVELTLNGQVIGNASSESTGDDHYVYASDATSSVIASANFDDIIKQYANIHSNYIVDPANYDAETGTLEVTEEAKVYTVTATDNNETLTASGEYNAPLLQKDGSCIEATGENFGYWKIKNTNEIISTDVIYNYRATGDMEIEAVYTESNDISIYIPQPVVSKTTDGNWLIEIPVTLNNAIIASDGNYELDPTIEDFGIIAAASGTSDEIITAAINGTSNSNVLVSSAKNGVTLTNKGRYLHTLTSNGTGETIIKAYYKTSDGNIGFSSVKTIGPLN